MLSIPLRYTPFIAKKYVIEQLIHWVFNKSIADGELDFLQGHWLKIEVTDLQLNWFLTLQDGRLVVSDAQAADVIFRGSANDLILIAARKEDPDSLFFQRRLVIEGDTELGLYVKSLMSSIDLDSMPKFLRSGLQHLPDFVDIQYYHATLTAPYF